MGCSGNFFFKWIWWPQKWLGTSSFFFHNEMFKLQMTFKYLKVGDAQSLQCPDIANDIQTPKSGRCPKSPVPRYCNGIQIPRSGNAQSLQCPDIALAFKHLEVGDAQSLQSPDIANGIQIPRSGRCPKSPVPRYCKWHSNT